MNLTDTQLELLILAGYSDEMLLTFAHENTKPADLYGAVAEVVTQALHGDDALLDVVSKALPGSALWHMKTLLEALTEEGDLRAAAKWWRSLGVGRSDTKSIVMTYLYGSTEYGNRDSIQERIEERDNEILEKALDPYFDRSGADVWRAERSVAVTLMVKLIRSAMGVVCPSTVETMDWIQQTAETMGNLDKPFIWKSPIMNFPVAQDNRNMVPKPVRIFEGGREVMKLIYRVPAADGKKLNARKMKAGAAPDVIHTGDAAHLMLSTLETDSTHFMHIHDSMSTQCAHTPDLANNIRKTFCDMYADTDYLYDIYEWNGGSANFLKEPKELGDLDVSDIVKSRYFFS